MQNSALKVICGILVLMMVLGTMMNTAFSGSGAKTSRQVHYQLQHPKLASNMMVVYIRADWCPACKNMKTGWLKVRNQYNGRVRFLTLDVTTKAKAAYSGELAKQWGLEDFYEKNKSRTSTVAIVALPSHKILKTFYNEPNPEAYAAAIDPLLATSK